MAKGNFNLARAKKLTDPRRFLSRAIERAVVTRLLLENAVGKKFLFKVFAWACDARIFIWNLPETRIYMHEKKLLILYERLFRFRGARAVYF